MSCGTDQAGERAGLAHADPAVSSRIATGLSPPITTHRGAPRDRDVESGRPGERAPRRRRAASTARARPRTCSWRRRGPRGSSRPPGRCRFRRALVVRHAAADEDLERVERRALVVDQLDEARRLERAQLEQAAEARRDRDAVAQQHAVERDGADGADADLPVGHRDVADALARAEERRERPTPSFAAKTRAIFGIASGSWPRSSRLTLTTTVPSRRARSKSML